MKQNKLFKLWLLAVILFAGSGVTWGQISIITTGNPMTENFNTLAYTAASSTVPSGWAFSESGSNANTTYSPGTGSGSTGDTYSFGSTNSTERAFGGLNSNNLTTTIGASYINNTGSVVTQLSISYYGEQWRLGATGREDKLSFSYSTDATNLTSGTWTNVTNLDFIAPITSGTIGALDGNATANRKQISYSITGLNIPNGSTFWIKFLDYNATGADDGLGIDDWSITANSSGSGTPPTLTADATNSNVDNNIDITFTDDATWRAAVTAVKVGGTALTETTDYVLSAGNLQLKPSGLNTLLTTSGSKTVTVEATGYSTASVTQQINVGADNKLAIKTQPAAPATNGAVLATQPAVYIQDQYGNTTTSTASVTATVGSGTWTIGGTSPVNGVSGTATFTDLTATSVAAVTGATITFTSSGLTAITSGTFNIPAPLPPSAPTATAATSVGTTGFTANWEAVSGATGYKLDVYTKTGGGNASDLFISEYIEGSSNNKAIEIYNGTGGSVDLSGYVLRHYNNGSSTPTYSLSLSGTLANDDVYIIANSSSTIFSGVDLSTTSNVMTFNGNDAIALYKNSTSSNIDVVGTIGDASDWGANITLVRKSAASVPSTTYSASDWDSYGNDVTTYLGSHTFAGGGSNSYVSGYQDLTVSGTSQAVSGLASGTTYYYVVRATNANGTSDNSNEISVTTSSATPTITVTELTIPAMSAVANSTTDSETINIGGTNLTGDITVTIDGTNAAMFSVVTNPSPLTSAGGTATITYTPTATGTHTATLRINSTGADEVTRELNGTATAAVTAGEVIITEVYGGGGNQFSSFKNDFIELYNTTDNPINISGWSMQYYAATGTGTTTNRIDITTGTIPAKGYFLVQADAGSGATLNLPVPDATGTTSLSSSSGKVILYNTTEAQTIDASSLASITGNSYYVDYVPFGTDAIPVYGSAMSVDTSNPFSAQRKSSAGVYAYTGDIGNDFEVGYPTPQNTTGNVVYYRTKGSGNWSSTAIWEKLTTNPEWADASTAPTSSEAFVYIENGDELTVNSEVTSPSVVVKPNGKLTVTSGGTLPVTGDLIIENNIVDGPGTITNNGSLTVSGNTFVNQYVNSARNWYMSASSGANAPTGNTYYEYLEDGSNTGFTAPASEYWKLVSSGTALTAGKGYIVATTGAKTITFTGGLNNGNVPVGLTRTVGATKEGFNLVGNPYPSYITWLESTATAANVEPSIWYRTHNGSGYEFQTYNAPSGVGVPSSASGYIPPMQAFWVRVKPTQTSGTLTFTNALRLHNDGTYSSLKAPAAKNTDRQLIRLQVSNGSTSDELVVYSNANASNGFDAYDSPKMLNGSTSAVPDMYTTAGSEKLVINGLNTLPLDVVIPVSFAANNASATSFTISANEISNLPSGVTVKVVDNNVETSLSDGGTYTFTANSGTTKTFGLVLRSPGFTTDVSNNSNNQFSVFVNANGKVLVNLNEKLNENTFISIFNAVGQQIIRQQITATTAEVNQALIPGVYLVQVNNGKISLTSKVIVR